MRIRQPVVQRRKAHLGAVADEQEDEREAQHGGFEIALHLIQMGPQQGVTARPEHFLGGEIEKDRPEQRLRNPDAAQNEVFPCGFQARRRAIEAHEQHGRERRGFHRHPQNAHVVGEQREQHGKGEHLVHAVVEPQPLWREPAMVRFDTHVGPAEERGGERDECGQRNQEHVERIDQKILVPDELWPFRDDAARQRRRNEQRQQTHPCVELGRETAMTPEREHDAAQERYGQDEEKLHLNFVQIAAGDPHR